MSAENIFAMAELLLAQTSCRQAVIELQQRFPTISEDVVEEIVMSTYGQRISTQLSALEIEKIKLFRNRFPAMTADDLRRAFLVSPGSAGGQSFLQGYPVLNLQQHLLSLCLSRRHRPACFVPLVV